MHKIKGGGRESSVGIKKKKAERVKSKGQGGKGEDQNIKKVVLWREKERINEG